MTQQDGVVRKLRLAVDGQYVYVYPEGAQSVTMSTGEIVEQWNRLVSLVQAQSEALEIAAKALTAIWTQNLGSSSLQYIARVQAVAGPALSAIRAQLGEKEE